MCPFFGLRANASTLVACRFPAGGCGRSAETCAIVLVMTGEQISDLLARYRAVLLEMHECRVETGGRPRKWNRLVDKMQSIHLGLRETPEGREGITRLAIEGENETVRSWSATNALAWDPDRVRPLIEAVTRGPGLMRLDAEMVLREFDAGRLNTAWAPKRG